jgi:hypothetical protein
MGSGASTSSKSPTATNAHPSPSTNTPSGSHPSGGSQQSSGPSVKNMGKNLLTYFNAYFVLYSLFNSQKKYFTFCSNDH